jgi:hypothetical protein
MSLMMDDVVYECGIWSLSVLFFALMNVFASRLLASQQERNQCILRPSEHGIYRQVVLRQFQVSSDMISLFQHDCFFVLLLFFLLVITAKPLYVQLEYIFPHSSHHHYFLYIVE